MVHILSLELLKGGCYNDIAYDGTEEELREALNCSTFIMFRDADNAYRFLIAADTIESIEYIQTSVAKREVVWMQNEATPADEDEEDTECRDCECADCCAESEQHYFEDFVEEDGTIDYDKLLCFVKDEFVSMGIVLSHWAPATRAINDIANKMFDHFDSFAPGLSIESKNEVILEAIGYASELLDSDDITVMVDDKFKADMKDHIMAGCTSALVADFI